MLFLQSLTVHHFILLQSTSEAPDGGGGAPYNGPYMEAPPERGTFFKLQVYERVGISLLGVYVRVGKSFILMCKKTPKRLTGKFLDFEEA